MKVVRTETLFKTKFLEMKSKEYIDNKGNVKHWDYVERSNQVNAVAVVGIIKSDRSPALDKIVLIKQFRIPLNDYIWELPAGLMDDEDETIEQTAIREFKEETGLTLKHITSIIPFGYNSAGMSTEMVAAVCGRVEGNVSTDLHEASEDIEVHLFQKCEVVKLLKDVYNCKAKIDIKTLLILKMFLAEDLTQIMPENVYGS